MLEVLLSPPEGAADAGVALRGALEAPPSPVTLFFFFDQLPPRLASVPRNPDGPRQIHRYKVAYSTATRYNFFTNFSAKNLAGNQFLDRPKIRHGRGLRDAP